MDYFSLRSVYYFLLVSSSLTIVGSQRTNSQISQRADSQTSQATELYGYESDSENTPLHRVASLKIARKMLQKGANPNVMNKYGQTPLHTAINLSRIELALLFVQNGASLTITDKYGNIPTNYLRYQSIPGNQEQYFENPEAYYNVDEAKQRFEAAAAQYQADQAKRLKSLNLKRQRSISQEGESSCKKIQK